MTLGSMLRVVVHGKLASWEEYLPLVEFAYNSVIHRTIGMTPFEVVYGFNPLTPLDLTSLSQGVVLRLDGTKRSEAMKKLHKKVRLHLEKKNQEVAKKANKGRKRVKLEPGDWVWVHFCKERFPTHRKIKLMPRGDGPFQVHERLNNNAYKIDLPPEYQVHNTFNVCDLSLFLTINDDDMSNFRTNSFQETENDAIQIPSRPFTRIQARDLQNMQGLFMKLEILGMMLIENKGYVLRNGGVLALLVRQGQSADRPRA
ncbi:hypothetical protein MTR67_053036 [Solanum verrucosum]|uniref:Tf2-1-like SH3-like domain-containing protein n=1 Tax=Solanum verrucosum TaxID=315347 RepID=A0AAF0VA83_SOLVR|nr:hypothetical protein MTR67_053036 [Solanum verrucosum]